MRGIIGTVEFEWEACDECKHGLIGGGCDMDVGLAHMSIAISYRHGIHDVECCNFEEGENHER